MCLGMLAQLDDDALAISCGREREKKVDVGSSGSRSGQLLQLSYIYLLSYTIVYGYYVTVYVCSLYVGLCSLTILNINLAETYGLQPKL